MDFPNFESDRREKFEENIDKYLAARIDEEISICEIITDTLNSGFGWSCPYNTDLEDEEIYVLRIWGKDSDSIEVGSWDEKSNMFMVWGFDARYLELKEITSIWQK